MRRASRPGSFLQTLLRAASQALQQVLPAPAPVPVRVRVRTGHAQHRAPIRIPRDRG